MLFIFVYRLNCSSCRRFWCTVDVFVSKLTLCDQMSVAAQYDRQAAGLREISAGRQFALHLLNLQQNDPGVSTSPFYDVDPF